MTGNSDPVRFEDGAWFFHDEVYHDHGPFRTEEEARLELGRYVKEVLGERTTTD